VEEQLSAGQVEEGEVVFDFLLPSNEQTTGAMEPTMRAFHDPAPCCRARMEELDGSFFTATADMGHLPPGCDLLPHRTADVPNPRYSGPCHHQHRACNGATSSPSYRTWFPNGPTWSGRRKSATVPPTGS